MLRYRNVMSPLKVGVCCQRDNMDLKGSTHRSSGSGRDELLACGAEEASTAATLSVEAWGSGRLLDASTSPPRGRPALRRGSELLRPERDG